MATVNLANRQDHSGNLAEPPLSAVMPPKTVGIGGTPIHPGLVGAFGQSNDQVGNIGTGVPGPEDILYSVPGLTPEVTQQPTPSIPSPLTNRDTLSPASLAELEQGSPDIIPDLPAAQPSPQALMRVLDIPLPPAAVETASGGPSNVPPVPTGVRAVTDSLIDPNSRIAGIVPREPRELSPNILEALIAMFMGDPENAPAAEARRAREARPQVKPFG